MPSVEVDLYDWRNAIMSPIGPRNALGRLVLLAVSLHINSKNKRAWPSQARIAMRTNVGLRSVKRHLDIAERDGWVKRTLVRVPGKKWRRTEYTACVPKTVWFKLPEKPWEVETRGATVALRKHGASTMRAREIPGEGDKVPTATLQGATNADQGANGDINKVPQLGLLTLNQNSLSNSLCEGAALPRRTAISEPEIKAKIQKLHRAGFQDDQIAKSLAQFGVSVEKVRQLKAAP